jgi:hypothetical protein
VTAYAGTKAHFLRPIVFSVPGFAFGLFVIARGVVEIRKSVAPDKKIWRVPDRRADQ